MPKRQFRLRIFIEELRDNQSPKLWPFQWPQQNLGPRFTVYQDTVNAALYMARHLDDERTRHDLGKLPGEISPMAFKCSGRVAIYESVKDNLYSADIDRNVNNIETTKEWTRISYASCQRLRRLMIRYGEFVRAESYGGGALATHYKFTPKAAK